MKLLKRVVVVLLMIEVVYLVLVNLALNVSLTQDIVNRIRPERFMVRWNSGWSWFPGQVSASGIEANGQSKGQQWQLAVGEVSGDVSLLPLISKKVRVTGAKATDVSFHLRPRPSADKDYADVRQFFPPIEGRGLEPREPQDSGAGKRSRKKPWDIEVDGIRASGSHNLWLGRMQAAFAGDIEGDFTIETQGGPMSLRNGALKVTLDSVVQDGSRSVLSEGTIDGEVEIEPVVPRDNKGVRFLRFLKLDTNLVASTESLKFLNPYLKSFQGMAVDGAGDVQGRVVLDQGQLRPGSALSIMAWELGLDVLSFRIEGRGGIDITVPEPGGESQVVIEFGRLDAHAIGESAPLLQGEGLEVAASGPTKIVPEEGERLSSSRLSVEIPSLRVPDLSRYERFLPDNWAVRLHGGEGELRGRAEVSDDTFDAGFVLRSDDADVGFKEFRFSSDLDMGVNVDSSSLEEGIIDVSGTYFHLSDSRLSAEGESAESWSAAVDLEKGIIRLNLDDAEEGAVGTRRFVSALKENGLGALMASADEELKIRAKVSDLRWLNLLFDNPYDLVIGGSGAVIADVAILAGRLDEGSRMTVEPESLTVDVLDYRAVGDGGIELEVVRGGERPDVALTVTVDNARFGRRDTEGSFIEGVDVSLEALTRSIDTEDEKRDVELRFSIPSARVTDMSVYNQYFPAGSPLRILGGEADLQVDVRLRPDDAQGFIRLVSSDMRSRIDEQEISGDLDANITLVGGVPRDRDFDISGSTIKLDGVRVIGKEKGFRDEDWAASIALTRARAVWTKPIRLDLEADLSMTDSMPIVSILANERGKHGWLEKAMTIDDVQGTASLRVENDYIVIPSAFVTSDKIDVGAKGVIREESRTGMVYVRYGKLRALLESKQGKRNLDIINTKKQFDAYSTDDALRSMAGE